MRSRRRLKMITAVGATLALVAGLAACTSGSDDDATPTPDPTTATTVPATPTVNCGNAVASIAPVGPLPPPGNMPGGTYMAQIQARGRLIAGVAADTLLFGYRNPLTGQLEGFDIDLVREVAQAIFGDPNRVEYKVMTYAQRIPALRDGSVDLVADVMTVNCERWEQISFSSQYFDAGQKVLVRTDSKATSIADLDGKKMCAANGSTNIENLKNYPKIEVVPVDDISDCMVLFQQGKVDSVTGDDTVLDGFVAQDPYAKIIGPPLTSEPYGLGVAKAHPEFVQFVNKVLQQLRDDGTWKQMYSRWFEPTGPVPNPPPAVYGRAS
jgi:polar amino acid transport system substrate-binding protein